MNYIKMFLEPDGPLAFPSELINSKNFRNFLNHKKYEDALQLSYDFYHDDVEKRRDRERNIILKYYTNTAPIENTKVGIGDLQGEIDIFNKENNFTYEDEGSNGYYDANGVFINPSYLYDNNTSKDDVSRLITHELAHEDLYLLRPGQEKTNAVQLFLQNNIANINITNEEENYLNEAYNVNDSKNGIMLNTSQGSKLIEEKHATNRELRLKLYQEFVNSYGRKPNNLEEFDNYINNFDPITLLEFLREINGYGEDYYYTNPNVSTDKIKQALIHVAQNNYQNSFDDQNIQYAKLGLKLNYLNLFK